MESLLVLVLLAAVFLTPVYLIARVVQRKTQRDSLARAEQLSEET